MKRSALLQAILILLLSGCSRKTHPSVSDNKPPPAVASVNTPLIIIDGLGRVITSKDALPSSVASQLDYTRLERAFTPGQKANLIKRYKILPPRILYIPEKYATQSLKGEYCVYKGKFWYWKKGDGLFHLDETYYK